MEPVTHLLYGATLSRTGLNRKTGLATLTLALAAEAPDLDMLLYAFGPVTGFGYHRGYTHTVVGAFFMSALVLAVVYGIYRFWFVRRGRDTRVPPNWKLLYLYAFLASMSHILLDFTNNYGVRPFMPLNYAWYSWDIVYIIEPAVTVPLLLGLTLPWFLGLIGGEIGAKRAKWPGRGSAIVALIVVAAVWWYRDMEHRQAVQLLNSQTYEGMEPVKVSANPYMLTPYKWHGVVETSNFFQTAAVDTMSAEVDPQQTAVTRYKPAETEISLAAKKSRFGQVYLDWARHPYAETEALPMPPGGAMVHLYDLRYAYPDRPLGVLSGKVELDSNNQPILFQMGRNGSSEKP